MEIPRLHPDTIETIKQRVDIVDVISEYVVLRKRGKDYVGCCPFHDEKTPSFSVSSNKQLYYCFGCNAGGNAIKFLMEVGKRSFSDVVLDLARRYQIPVQTLEPEQRANLQRQLSLREQLYEILALATEFFKHALRQSQGQHALKYLQVTRCFSEETIQRFGLGYAPQGWEVIYRYLVEQKGKPVQLVEKAGLIKPRKEGNGYYDCFRDRLIIPIHDSQGRVIAFGGRTLGEEQPKYLNSPETELFNKGKTLFALDQAKEAISKQDKAVVVEGYFDAIALHGAGINNVVASLGTALSLDQVKQILRYTESKQIILNFDADAAGITASQRAIGEIANLAYQGQIELKVLNLPNGKDADEFLKSDPDGAQKYLDLLQNAPVWLDWQIEQLIKGKDLKQAHQFQQAAQEIVKLLNQLEDINKLTYYINHCAQLLSLGQTKAVPLLIQSLQTQIKKTITLTGNKSHPLSKSKKANKSQVKVSLNSDNDRLAEAEASLLRIYLHCPEYRQTIIASLEEQDLLFNLSHHRFLWQQILQLQPQLQVSRKLPDQLISLLQEQSLKFPEQMSQVAHLFHLDEKKQEDIARATLQIKASIACLEQIVYEQHKRYYLDELLTSDDLQRKKYCSQEIEKANQRINELEPLRRMSELEQLS